MRGGDEKIIIWVEIVPGVSFARFIPVEDLPPLDEGSAA